MSARVIQKIIQFIHLVLHRGFGSFTSNPYIFKINNIVPRCSGTFIKNKAIRTVGIFASFALTLLTVAAVFPITHKTDTAEATYVPATTTLSIVSSKDTASVDITPTSASGTFATSAAADMAEFTVTTDNLTGYSLNILGTDTSGQLVNSTTGDTLDTITSDTTENDFRTGNTSTYNNKWGYRLTVNSTTTTDFFSAPTSTSTAKTIYTTSAPNTTGTSDSFTLGVGARVDYTKPVGTYTNTFVLTAVANNISYQINYLDADGTTQLLTPDAESDISASSIELNSTTPTKSGYEFKGWCDGTLSSDGTSCTGTPGTTYQPGDTYTFTSFTSGTTTANLYAVWEESAPTMQDLNLSQCTTAPMTVKDSRDNQEYVIQKLTDGNCWMMTNLNLGATALTTDLTSANTNLSTTITAATFNGWKKSTGTVTYTAGEYIPVSGTDSTSQTPYGTLYNYCATSAGTICTSSNSSNATYDICPKGWRLPTGGSSGEFQTLYNQSAYNTNAKMRAPIASGGAAFALAGYFYGAAPVSQGSYGYYWSSTWFNSNHMYDLNLLTSSVSPADFNARYRGHSIRCILDDVPTMQNVTSTQLDKLIPNAGDVTYLKDNRDGTKYKVSRLADGNVWMQENLALDLTDSTVQTNLTEATTNATTASLTNLKNNVTTSWTDTLTDPVINTASKDTVQPASGSAPAGKIGVYYNYCASSAGTYCIANGSGSATEDICPAGWRMPTGGASGEYQALYTAYNSNVANFESALSTPLSGGFIRNSPYYPGTFGAFWTSDTYSGTEMYYLDVRASAVGAQTGYPRSYGLSIRCIKDNSDLPVMQNISQSQLDTLIPNTGDSVYLKDNRDGTKYKVARLADGNVWMQENLALDLTDSTVQTNLTEATTNATTASLTSLKNNVSTSWADSYTDPKINTTYKDTIQVASGSAPAGKIGVYYNFCAASANSYCVSSGSSDASQDICPAGWRMPTGGASGEYQALYTAYSSNVANFKAALNTPLSGSFQSGTANYRGTYGYFWSSVVSSNSAGMNGLRVDSSPVDPNNTLVRAYGNSVRCLRAM